MDIKKILNKLTIIDVNDDGYNFYTTSITVLQKDYNKSRDLLYDKVIEVANELLISKIITKLEIIEFVGMQSYYDSGFRIYGYINMDKLKDDILKNNK